MRITMTFDKGWSESDLGRWPVTAIEVIAIEVEVLTIEVLPIVEVPN